MIAVALAAVVAVGAALDLSSTASAVSPSIKGGKFEVTCKPHAIHDIAIDPIVSPGVPSMHYHTFFGNKGITDSSTPPDLRASTAGTTCVLNQDTAAYWVPVACDGPCVDADGNPDMGMQTEPPIANVVPAVKIFGYYFGTAGVKVAQYPAGLEFIGGDVHRTGPWPDKTEIEFHCGNGGSHHSPVRTAPYDCTSANGVRGTDGVVAVVKFPYCLQPDGSVVYGGSGGTCPVGTDTLGQVQIHVHYGHNTSGFQKGSQLNFASGPYYTFHGDWMNGWDQPKLQALVAGCLQVNKDCGFLNNSHPGPGGAVKGKMNMKNRRYAARVRTRINGYRMSHGLRRLRVGYRLTAAAREHSRMMGRTGVFSHGSWLHRIRSHDVRALRVGEILAEGFATPQAAVQAWMASPEHRQVMSTRGFRRLGVGVAHMHGKWWITVDFGSGAPS